MENIDNVWFQTHKRMIEQIKRQLLEYSYAGSYGGSIDLPGVIKVIDGAILEILKLEKDNKKKEEELRSLRSKLDEKKTE